MNPHRPNRTFLDHWPKQLLWLPAVSLAALFLAWGCTSRDEGQPQKPVIKLHDSQGETHRVSNAIFEFIVENGYGYPVETVVETTPTMKDALPVGEIDLNLEGWQQNIIDWYDEHIETGDIVNLGAIYEGGPQFFIIPRWVAEQYAITTVFDMRDHWDLFTDPQDPSKGVFYNCIDGWQCAEINRVKLEAYGLAQSFNLASPAPSAALEAALADRQATSTELLSGREVEVLQLMAKGAANKEIAASLSISESTVKTHVANIFGKLEVNDRTGAVTTAMQKGIIKL